MPIPDENGRTKIVYDPDRVLTVALDLCEGMLESGAEIHRVEDTAERICRAYGAERIEIFAISSLIVATIAMDGGKDCTQARRVYGNVNNLFRIEKLNALSRAVCRDVPDPESVIDEIRRIRLSKGLPLWVKFIGGILGAFGFTLFFGGTPLDAAIAALVGTAVCYLDFNRPKYLNQIAYTVIVSAVGSLLIGLIDRFLGGLIPINASMISIGVIMLLIPGLALGNAVRDLLCGEVVSGAVKSLQSVLVAGAIALGFTSILWLFGGSNVVAVGSVHPLLSILWAGIGTLGFSLIFNVPLKRSFFAVLCGMFCWTFYMIASQFSIPGVPTVLFASVIGGIACTAYSEVMARLNKTPTTIFLIAGLIPLVPGSALYYTMAYIVQQDRDMAISKGLDTLLTCIGIGIGVVIVSVIFQIGTNWRKNLSKRVENKKALRGEKKAMKANKERRAKREKTKIKKNEVKDRVK